jgi:hypothetical protein
VVVVVVVVVVAAAAEVHKILVKHKDGYKVHLQSIFFALVDKEGTGSYDLLNKQTSVPNNRLSLRQEVGHKYNTSPYKPPVHSLVIIIHESSRNIQL